MESVGRNTCCQGCGEDVYQKCSFMTGVFDSCPVPLGVAFVTSPVSDLDLKFHLFPDTGSLYAQNTEVANEKT